MDKLKGAKASGCGPFGRPEWFALQSQYTEASAILAEARNEEGAVFLPLLQQGSTLTALGNWYSFVWQPLLVGNPDVRSAMTAIAQDLKSRTSAVRLEPLAEPTPLSAAFRSAGWWVRQETCDTNHYLALDGMDYAAYLKTRPGKLRTSLKRKAGKVNVTIHDRFDPGAWADYEAVYAASWKPAEGAPALLRDFGEEEGTAGRLRLGIAQAEGQPIAAQFWTVEAGTAYIHKLAHTEASKALSPGTTLTAAMLERVIDTDKVSEVDFGTGNDAYKADWMNAARPRYRIECRDPLKPSNWPGIARGTLRKLAKPGVSG